MPTRKLTIFLLGILAWQSLLGQPSNASFLHYTTEEGLSHDNITAITKDKLGFLWVGTANGLNRFDGRNFRIFRHDPTDKNSIPNNHVTGLTLAPDGWLWVATDSGLCKIDPLWLDVDHIRLPENDDTIRNDATTVVAFDSKGMAWTTGQNGIYQINPTTNKPVFFFKTEQNVIGWVTTKFDKAGKLWLINVGLRRFDPATQTLKEFKGANAREAFEMASALSVVQDFSGQIWAGTWFAGIWKFNPALDEFVKSPSPTSLAPGLLPDTLSTGRLFLWVGGGKSGLAIYYPDTHQIVDFKNDPRDPHTHNNYLGRVFFKNPKSEDVWIGTEIGLERYAPNALRFGRAMIPPEKDMGQFSLVSGVAHDNTDPTGLRYFIGVWGTGLFEWNMATGDFTRLKSDKSKFPDIGIFNIFQDSKGFLWGCLNSAIGRYNPRTGQWRDYLQFFKDNSRDNVVWCGLEDRKGNLWFGTRREGVYRYNPTTDKMEQALYAKEFADGNGNMNIVGMSEDGAGRLWLASPNTGLIRFDPATGTSKQFTYPGQKTSNSCGAVVCAKSGRIYAAFHETFVELDSEGTLLRRFNNDNGLKTSRLNFLVADKQGRIWFNSEYLLHCFDPATGIFNYYGKGDGLFSNTMTDALSITPSGEIFVGFQNAFNFFYPEKLRRNTLPPPVAITGIRVMNKARELRTRTVVNLDFGLFNLNLGEIQRDTFLTLRPGEDFFEVEFAGLNFSQPERNQYAYLLEGFNKDWVYTDRPIATFTNLNGGKYYLHMKAANNDGVWNHKGTTLAILVKPPFHQTWWFQVLALMALSGMVMGVIWFRRKQRQRLETFREGLARDLHDEMGSTLSSIRFFSEFAKQKIGEENPTVTPVLHRISESASSLSESMQDIIWAMKTKNDQMEDLAARMTEFGLRLMESRNMRFSTHVNEGFTGKQLKPEQRRNVYLIFKEAVNNAAKYADATEVQLFLSVKSGLLLMKVVDNGKGFDLANEEANQGNGLLNMRQRAADIGGKVEIFSKPGEGTRVELRVSV